MTDIRTLLQNELPTLNDVNNKEALIASYQALKEAESVIANKLVVLKTLAKDLAPELLAERKSVTFTITPTIHKLPIEFYSLSNAKVNATFKSALGGDKFLQKYGLTREESVSHSWKPLNSKQNKEAN